jgi:hypothetical protein
MKVNIVAELVQEVLTLGYREWLMSWLKNIKSKHNANIAICNVHNNVPTIIRMIPIIFWVGSGAGPVSSNISVSITQV